MYLKKTDNFTEVHADSGKTIAFIDNDYMHLFKQKNGSGLTVTDSNPLKQTPNEMELIEKVEQMQKKIEIIRSVAKVNPKNAFLANILNIISN